MKFSFSQAQLSDRGGREINEDYALSWQENDAFCWVLADGLGGHGAGDVAARICCESIVESFRCDPEVSSTVLCNHILRADQMVRSAQLAHPSLQRMRTTVVVLLANSRQAVLGHAGDSRCYHFRHGRIIYQTRDHSLTQRRVDVGEIGIDEIRRHKDRGLLLRALGGEEPVHPAICPTPIELAGGDAFLLCSDGFWENVNEIEMEIDLVKSLTPQEWLFQMQYRLKDRVSGSYDNYTAIAVSIIPRD